MERLKTRNLSFSSKIFTKVVIALGMMVYLSACGKSDNGAHPVANNPIYGNNCVNCAQIASPVVLTTVKAQSFSGGVSLQGLQIIAQSTAIIPRASGNNFYGYRGPIAAQGLLVVNSPQYDYVAGTNQMASACVLPMGTYQLQTTAVGQMDYEGVNIFIPSLVTMGGAIEVKVEAPAPMGLLDLGTTLWAKVSIVRVNGVMCSADFFGNFK